MNKHKKLTLWIICLALFSQCEEKKEDNGITTASQYIGKWQQVSVIKTECKRKGGNETKTFDCKKDTCQVLTLTIDLTYKITVGNISKESGKWKATANTISLCAVNEDDTNTCSESQVKISGTQLTLTTKNEGTGCKLQKVYKKI